MSTPRVGTRWYAGRPAYWLHRALVSLGWLAIAGVIAAIVESFFAGILSGSEERPPNRAPGLLALGIVIAVTIAGFVYMWRRTSRLSPRQESDREFGEAMIFFIALGGFGWALRILFVVTIVAGGVVALSISRLLAGITGVAIAGAAAFLLGPVLALFVRTLIPAQHAVRVR